MEQPDVRRVRAQWDCDGDNLLINVRDDGGGALAADGPGIGRLDRRVQALAGHMQIDVMRGRGADVSVTLPLDPPADRTGDVAGWNFASPGHSLRYTTRVCSIFLVAPGRTGSKIFNRSVTGITSPMDPSG